MRKNANSSPGRSSLAPKKNRDHRERSRWREIRLLLLLLLDQKLLEFLRLGLGSVEGHDIEKTQLELDFFEHISLYRLPRRASIGVC